MNNPNFSCQEQIIPGDTYQKKFDFLVEIGFSGIEIWSDNLLKHSAELRELVMSTGLRVSSGCQSFEGGLIDTSESARQNAIRLTIESLKALSLLKGSGYVVPAGFALGSLVLPPYRPPRPPEEDAQSLMDALSQILPEAEKLGVSVLLEPINRYETHFLHTLAEAETILSRINHPSLRMVADFFHMNIEEAQPDTAIRRAGKWIDHVHLADSQRKLPGQGHLDFVKHFSALHQIGFEGWMAIECDQPEDAETELTVASKFLYGSWEKASEIASNRTENE